jgi:hypothetical protein
VTEVIDSLDHHLDEAGSIERAAVPLGMYLAWCANLHLLSRAFQEQHQGALTRLRYRDLSPAEFLTATGDGSLVGADLSEEGLDFTRTYYEHYLDDFRGTFDGAAYTVKDDWAHYDKIAAVLTRRFMRTKGHPDDRGEGAGERNRGRKRWWQVWR